MVKERPILFSAEMVRAILDGRKTQTRWVVKPQPHAGIRKSVLVPSGIEDGHGRELRCPYGVPRDRLWVRETWRVGAWHEAQKVALDYKADGYARREWLSVPQEEMFERLVSQSLLDAIRSDWPSSVDGSYTWPPGHGPTRWRPSIHMPRWASRITLEVVSVRVERVQDITARDAEAEGIINRYQDGSLSRASFALRAFSELWDSINAKRSSAPREAAYSWKGNPWVWVVEFKVMP